ncbi:hypothetical protein EX30DRAFT_144914 [Ascodesmis nigricans]|uniref:CCD97-like C-terminal domain-containing protein n=1 Tax=Ascodesmis nigricans TaxID=341454 RepID=A0A4S2N1V0_9PEZI|nr:hypothetical protein EX30DRAFT_144914 [Ascodesmis nigricans]
MPALVINPIPPHYSSPSLGSSSTPPTSPPSIPPSPRSEPITLAHALHRAQRPPSRLTTIRNRRLCYLRSNPSYFTSPDLELADPLLYDRLIRRFLTPAEREEQGRTRGFSGVLEADILRSEAKIAAIQDAEADTEEKAVKMNGDEVETREEGEELWRRVMTERFLAGNDKEVDYKTIDENEAWDGEEMRRDEEERWFDAETPRWVDGGGEEEGLCTDTGVLDY